MKLKKYICISDNEAELDLERNIGRRKRSSFDLELKYILTKYNYKGFIHFKFLTLMFSGSPITSFPNINK